MREKEMDKVTPYQIKNNISLDTGFNIPASVAENWQGEKPFWLLYGKSLQGVDGSVLGNKVTPLNAWSVGPYQVLAIAGALTPEIKSWVDERGLDCAQMQPMPTLKKPGLIVLDMDSTSVQIECIDEIAKLAGVGDEVSEVTERAMRGELDFEQSLRARVGKLEGADEGILQQVRRSLPLMPEIKEMVKTLYKYGWYVAIASGGFTYFSDYLKDELQLVHAESNQLEIKDGLLTGKVIGKVVDAQEKANILLRLAKELGIDKDNLMAVGDGANDLTMMKAAGFGVAYHAKPKVVQEAPAAISHAHLGGIICLLSVSLQ